MKLFQNLFTPKWKNKNPEIRKQALIELNRNENQNIFSEIVSQDDTSEIRQIAVKRINDLDQLIKIAADNTDSNVRELASKIVSQILAGISDAGSSFSATESQRLETLQTIKDQKCLEFVAQKADLPAIRKLALGKISRESLLGDMAINDRDPEIRKLVAARINQKSTLDRVYKAIKNKDKQTSKIIKEKLDRILAEEERPKKILASQKSLCQNMEQLGKKGLWERDKIIFDQLVSEWEAFSPNDNPDLHTRFKTASHLFQSKYDDYLIRNENRLKEEAQLLPLKENKQQILERLHQLLSNISNPDTAEQLAQMQQEWTALEKLPDDIEQEFEIQYRDVSKNIRAELKQIQGATQAAIELGRIHDDVSRMLKKTTKLKSGLINRIQKQLDAIQTTQADLLTQKTEIKSLVLKAENILQKNKQKADDLFSDSEKLISELDKILEHGEVKSANELQKKIQSNIKQLEKLTHDSLTKLKSRFSETSTKLFELNKWRSWANTPQKERLVKEMEALIGSELPAKEVAFLVSKARKEWQRLGPSERQSSQELWERFNKACDLAYEPCKAVFESEAKIRHENYDKRIEFLNNLEAFIEQANWDTVNWVKVENLFHQSRTEWQNLGPVDKNKRKPLNNRFNQAHNAPKEHLSNEWNKNIQTKENIVDQATQLIEHENLNEAIQSAKNLQAQWQKAGRVPRSKEKQLWSAFRESCDKIFARRDSFKQQQQEDQKQLDQQKEVLCRELESLCEMSAENIGEHTSKVQSLKNEISNLINADKSANKTVDKNIRERLNHAMHIYELKLETLQRIQQIHSLGCVKNAAAFLRTLENKSETQSDEESAQKFSELITMPNSFWRDTLQQRFDHLQEKPYSNDELDANEKLAKNAITYLEIIAEVETPSENAAERLTAQTERLNARLTSGEEISQWDDFVDAEARFLLCGPLSEAIALQLEKRHNQVVSAMKNSYPEELKNY